MIHRFEPILGGVDLSVAVLSIAVIVGALVGVVSTLLWFRRSPAATIEAAQTDHAANEANVERQETGGSGQGSANDFARLLEILPIASVLVDTRSGLVLRASDQAVSLGLVTHRRIVIPELVRMVADARRDSAIHVEEIAVRLTPLAGGRMELSARVALMNPTTVLVLVENLSGARRVDEVRRDFIANVSHELKTPVGALSLLSEAVLSAVDDPDAVRHFAGRMQAESARLAHLVADLIDLSRLQGDDPMAHAARVSVDEVITEAVEAMRMVAQSDNIEIVSGGVPDLSVFGVESQLVTALRNLLANAVAYSPPGTRVAVGTRLTGDVVEIAVTDQGIGIPPQEIERIFERFYRVDQARSRVTGGTGLGLSIVKHVCRNHGGEVAVWSVEGAGSTFTLRLPASSARQPSVDIPQQTPEGVIIS